ncbi:MAG: URC4/urg3 family protein [Alphaproteobacteria bacterium]|nr:URC4/urg3 family protein [Alphaproteobacteria bacterium]
MRRSKLQRRRPPDISLPPGCRTRPPFAVPEDVPSTSESSALLSAAAVRARCAIVSEMVERDGSRHFRLVPARLDQTAARVAAVTRRRYPDLAVPYHSRWRHFSTGGLDRTALVAPGADKAETARARIDLAVVSVLLDAGAGSGWHYREAATGAVLSRSEGLAVASLRAMEKGLFSVDPCNPWRADAEALARITPEALAAAFQHAPGNELMGLDGRARLLRRLGEVCAQFPHLFGAPARPGRLYDHWVSRGTELPAPEILCTVLQALAPIWPPPVGPAGILCGDCGRHRAVSGDGVVPFHKLSQWLAYSLVEPLQDAGLHVIELDGLTGLAEYRNGGLFLDCGVIEPRDPDLLQSPLDALSELVIEWRALTVTLLDRLAVLVRERLGRNAKEFPLACVLEGGSWAAGREIAYERRADGPPPLTVISDGTLF